MKSRPITVTVCAALVAAVALLLFKHGLRPNETGRTAGPQQSSAASEQGGRPAPLVKVAPTAATIEMRIEAQYQALIAKRTYPVSKQMEKYYREKARLMVTDPEALNRQKLEAEQKESAGRQPVLDPLKIKKYLEEKANTSAFDIIIAAYAAGDPSLITNAIKQNPNNVELTLAHYLYNDTYLRDAAAVVNNKELNLSDPRLALVAARAALSIGDADAAAQYLPMVINAAINNNDQAYTDAWGQLRTTLKATNDLNGEALLGDYRYLYNNALDTHAFMAVNDAERYYREHPGLPASESIIHSALTMAEIGAESPVLVQALTSLAQQERMLKLIGEQTAQRLLDSSYNEVLADLRAQRANLTSQMQIVEQFKTGLTAESQLMFEKRVREIGDWSAYQESKPN